MSAHRFSSVWDAIEGGPAEVETMKLRFALMIALRDHIGAEWWSQAHAAEIFGVTQPRVSDVIRGKIDPFAIDALVTMLSRAGLHVELRVSKAA